MVDPESSGVAPLRAPVAYLVAETLAFLSELALLGALGLVGWRLGTGGLISVSLAVLYPALATLIWALWIAPTAPRRLEDPWRLIAQITLFLLAGMLAVVTGLVVWGSVLAAVGIAAFAATRVLAAPPR